MAGVARCSGAVVLMDMDSPAPLCGGHCSPLAGLGVVGELQPPLKRVGRNLNPQDLTTRPDWERVTADEVKTRSTRGKGWTLVLMATVRIQEGNWAEKERTAEEQSRDPAALRGSPEGQHPHSFPMDSAHPELGVLCPSHPDSGCPCCHPGDRGKQTLT